MSQLSTLSLTDDMTEDDFNSNYTFASANGIDYFPTHNYNSENKHSITNDSNIAQNSKNSSNKAYNNSKYRISTAIPNFNTISQFNQSALVSDLKDSEFDNNSFAYARGNDHISKHNHMSR